MMDTPRLTESDLALLARPLYGMLTIAAAPRRLPAPRPVWFETTTEGTIQIFSAADAPRIRRLSADPQASFVVAKPPGESEGWVSIEADITLHTDGAEDLALRLTDRYWDDDHAEQRAEAKVLWTEWGAAGTLRRLVLHPRRVVRGPAS